MLPTFRGWWTRQMEASPAAVGLPFRCAWVSWALEEPVHKVGMNLSGTVDPEAGNSFLILSKYSQKGLCCPAYAAAKLSKPSTPFLWKVVALFPFILVPLAWVTAPWTNLTLALFWHHSLFINHGWANSCYRGMLCSWINSTDMGLPWWSSG